MQARFDLLQIGWIKRTLRSRWFQPALGLVMLFFFTIAILTGLFGTPAGSHNFSIVYIWIVWWALLMILLVPFFGRLWCLICPLPLPGEWLQRRAIVQKVHAKLNTRKWCWPNKLKNIWLQNFAFLSMALFSTIILTRPSVTAWVLLEMMLAAIGLSIFYEKRIFCRYVCPVGGFIGLYSLASGLELRVRDVDVCQAHTSKDCVKGNACGYGCPWMVYPGKLEANTYCGLCTECIKTCTEDNISLNIRPLGTDLPVLKNKKLDEAYKSIIMLTCAVTYSAVLLGPWGWIKRWANMDTAGHWAMYAAGFLLVNLIIMPVLFLIPTFISKKLANTKTSLRKWFIEYAYALIPIGLAGWMAFSLGFVLINGSYALTTLSDPFGWGWNLFNTAQTSWQPVFSGSLPYLQSAILYIGLWFSILLTYRIGKEQLLNHNQALTSSLPFIVFLFGISSTFTYLFLG